MKDHDLTSSTIYTADVLENGVFGDSSEIQVTAENKRDYWRKTLHMEVSTNLQASIVHPHLIHLLAGEGNTCPCPFYTQDVRSCSANARSSVGAFFANLHAARLMCIQ